MPSSGYGGALDPPEGVFIDDFSVTRTVSGFTDTMWSENFTTDAGAWHDLLPGGSYDQWQYLSNWEETMGPINPVGHLRMLHSSQMVGLYILPPANLGPLEMYQYQWLGSVCMAQWASGCRHGIGQSARSQFVVSLIGPPITFLWGQVLGFPLTTISVQKSVGMVVPCTPASTTGPLGKSTDKIFHNSMMFNIGIIHNRLCINNGLGTVQIRRWWVYQQQIILSC